MEDPNVELTFRGHRVRPKIGPSEVPGNCGLNRDFGLRGGLTLPGSEDSTNKKVAELNAGRRLRVAFDDAIYRSQLASEYASQGVVRDDSDDFMRLVVPGMNRISPNSKRLCAAWMRPKTRLDLFLKEHREMLPSSFIETTGVQFFSDDRLFDQHTVETKPWSLKELFDQIKKEVGGAFLDVGPLDFGFIPMLPA